MQYVGTQAVTGRSVLSVDDAKVRYHGMYYKVSDGVCTYDLYLLSYKSGALNKVSLYFLPYNSTASNEFTTFSR